MNDIMRNFPHKFVIVYLDNISVFSRTLEKHLEHTRLVLSSFKEEGLKLRLKNLRNVPSVFKRWST
jgi:hypothetical protein